MDERKAAAYRTGFITLIVLAVLTAVEYWAGVSLANPVVALVILAILKAGIIVQNFMHIARLWREESH
jgi:cytochrome c oxidase subunit IV